MCIRDRVYPLPSTATGLGGGYIPSPQLRLGCAARALIFDPHLRRPKRLEDRLHNRVAGMGQGLTRRLW
eukprot:4802472-Pyramimonas_sp.AAC.1